MVTPIYTSVSDVADFLRIPITATTVPNDAQVEKLINRMECRLDRRVGHAWRIKTITNETHDLPLIYAFGFGTLISLHHRAVQPLCVCLCDRLEVWTGTTGCYECIISSGRFEEINGRGEVYVRGYLFSIMRKNRVRLTYRYGGEPGDTPSCLPVPFDIQDATLKMTAVDLLSTSFRMDQLPLGNDTVEIDKAIARWTEDANRVIRDREEVFVVTT